MVLHHQPLTLYKRCHDWLTSYLGDTVVHASYDNPNKIQHLSRVRLKWRPFFLERLPVVIRTSLLESTSTYLFQKSSSSSSSSLTSSSITHSPSSSSSSVDCDYGRSILHLLSLLLSKEVKRVKVILCCYYGCRDMESILRCIKKNGDSLEYLELTRTSLLRMDPLLFRNVVTSAPLLTSLIVKNICSDAMLKLIGTHCHLLQYLDLSCSKQVSDTGIQSLCCQMLVRDKNTNSIVRPRDSVIETRDKRISSTRCCCSSSSLLLPCWSHYSKDESNKEEEEEGLIEVKQVLHPLCSTLKVLNITDITSITNSGILVVLKKLKTLISLGEYCLSDTLFKIIKPERRFEITDIHTRKLSRLGVLKFVSIFQETRSLTCWDPIFDITELCRLKNLTELTLCRIPFSETNLKNLIRFFETVETCHGLRSLVFEFLDSKIEYIGTEVTRYWFNVQIRQDVGSRRIFNFSPIWSKCHRLRKFSIQFKDNYYSSTSPHIGFFVPDTFHSYTSLTYVQLGHVVENTAVSYILLNCPNLLHFHCHTCHQLTDMEFSILLSRKSESWADRLECFYIYEAPQLTIRVFQTLLDAFPRVKGVGNLTRWAVTCDDIQRVIRTIQETNMDMEILCGSHWFTSTCLKRKMY